jgi:preprotein translocase subunit SecG
MNTTLHTLLIVVQVLTALSIIVLVLLQHGKGADMGAAFGSGASGSLFGATGSSNFLSKSTGVAAAIFFAATLGLAFLGNRPADTSAGVMDKLPVQPATAPGTAAPGAAAPAVPAPAPAGQAPAAPAAPSAPATAPNQIPK